MTILRRFRLLPLLVLAMAASFLLRLGNVVTGLGGDARAEQKVEQADDAEPPVTPPAEAAAQKEEEAGKEDPPEGEKKEEAEKKEADPASGEEADEEPVGEEQPDKAQADWRDSVDTDIEFSDVQEGLHQDLAKRREELEGWEKTLSVREALLKAGERELDQKLRELTAVRKEIEGLLSKQSEEEQGRISSLVRIYEGMKAKDAARIFDTLDMDVLIRVMSVMSERKSGPILAEMNPERARAVTILLAQQKQLPQLPPQ